jgi:hypothetical protein
MGTAIGRIELELISASAKEGQSAGGKQDDGKMKVKARFFGGAEPGEDDYRLCVERFRRFAEVYVRGVRS